MTCRGPFGSHNPEWNGDEDRWDQRLADKVQVLKCCQAHSLDEVRLVKLGDDAQLFLEKVRCCFRFSYFIFFLFGAAVQFGIVSSLSRPSNRSKDLTTSGCSVAN